MIKGKWQEMLADTFKSEYYKTLYNKINEGYKDGVVHTSSDKVFAAFDKTPYESVKVVMACSYRDWYERNWNGLLFSSTRMQECQTILNVKNELREETGIDKYGNVFDTTKWAEQGVLMYALHQAVSSLDLGREWVKFYDDVIKALNDKEEPVMFIFMGRDASEAAKYVTGKQHDVLIVSNPSPVSLYRGFRHSDLFNKASAFVRDKYGQEIDWEI